MSKREFLIQYVLNRALGASRSLEGSAAAIEAGRAWEQIDKEMLRVSENK